MLFCFFSSKLLIVSTAIDDKIWNMPWFWTIRKSLVPWLDHLLLLLLIFSHHKFIHLISWFKFSHNWSIHFLFIQEQNFFFISESKLDSCSFNKLFCQIYYASWKLNDRFLMLLLLFFFGLYVCYIKKKKVCKASILHSFHPSPIKQDFF